MAEKLADLFEQTQARAVTWQGHTVHSMVERVYPSGTTLRVTFEDPNPARPEGLRFRVRGGTARIADQELDDVVFWSDSAPRVVEAELVASEPDTQLHVRLWNCWRDPNGTVQAWIGNAGMLVEEAGSGFRLRCSDGFDEVTFADLVASIETSGG